MIEPIGYKLNPKKLQKAPQYITPYLFLGAFYYTEDYDEEEEEQDDNNRQSFDDTGRHLGWFNPKRWNDM